MKQLTQSLKVAIAAISATTLLGCGGSGGGGGSAAAAVNGTSFASYIAGANIEARDLNGNTLAGPVVTDAMGRYQLNIPQAHLTSPMLIRSSGGQFTDEATGQQANAAEMNLYLAAGALAASGTAKANLTPASAIIARLITHHGKTAAEANALAQAALGYLPDSTVDPVDATASNDSATAAQKLKGLRAAAFSQLANDLGMTPAQQFDLIAKLASDLSDGSLDGKEGSADITGLAQDIQSKIGQSLIKFLADSKNKTGLKNNQIGVLPQFKVVKTDNYIFEHQPGMMGPMVGYNTMKVRITDLDGNPQAGLTPMLMPMMYMEMHNHSTPIGGVEEQADGVYVFTLYYLMASAMMSGDTMGYWDLKIKVGTDEAHFYPKVMMEMGTSPDTARSTLYLDADQVTRMGMQDARRYLAFNRGLTKNMGGGHDFEIFLAAQESMMSFPAVIAGNALDDGNSGTFLLNTVAVEMSTDQTNWSNATTSGEGIWKTTGLTGLSETEQNTLYVRVTINGDQLNDNDGNPALFTLKATQKTM